MNGLGGCLDALAAMALLVAWWRTDRNGERDWRWLVPAGILLLIGLQHVLQFDAVTQDRLRALARAQGAYDGRRQWQVPVVLGTVFLAGAMLFRINGMLRETPPLRRTMVVVLGYAAFDFIRWVSLHQVDTVLYRKIGPLHVNHLLEAGLIALSVGAAVPAIRGKAVTLRRREPGRKYRQRR